MKAKADDVALKMNGQSMTYQELDDYSNSMAQTLIQNGIQKGERVALLTERSFEMVASMIAVLKLEVLMYLLTSLIPINALNLLLKTLKSQQCSHMENNILTYTSN